MLKNLFAQTGVSLLLCLVGCGGATDIVPDWEEPDAGSDTNTADHGFQGVDLLIVVDNTVSMAHKQQQLGTEIFVLINSLVAPLPSSPYDSVDNLRIAVTTTDLGLSWGGNPYSNDDCWPGAIPSGCEDPFGDYGIFQPISAENIEIEHAAIPCNSAEAHCPSGWSCSAQGTNDEGVCMAPGGQGYQQVCPELDGQHDMAETLYIAQNQELALEAACLIQQGTEGCGWEQPLRAGVESLSNEYQAHFVRDQNLLAVIFLTDEDDCSLESNAIFGTDEIQDASTGFKHNLACAKHPEHLYSTKQIYDDYNRLKLNPDEVFFAAFVGVPMVAACQGPGNELGGCLDDQAMELVEYKDTSTNIWYFEDACNGGSENAAKPARRFVELAGEHFGSMGYVYSICNDDWTPAMQEIGKTIAKLVEGTDS